MLAKNQPQWSGASNPSSVMETKITAQKNTNFSNMFSAPDNLTSAGDAALLKLTTSLLEVQNTLNKLTGYPKLESADRSAVCVQSMNVL